MAPNTNTCPVCLGFPGALPSLNKNLVEYIMRMGVATHCAIRSFSTFARKNYFYPDLPKGYQISQHNDPICYSGYLEIDTDDAKNAPAPSLKRIGITRIHMEEDAGKSIHDIDVDTLVDLNRSGVPLIEIVSEPDIRSAKEAVQYLKELRKIVMALGICDGNMEEGSLRCDVNISVRKIGEEKLNPRVEIKNLNSFKSVESAIEYEFKRQCELYDTLAPDQLDLSSATGRFDVTSGEVKKARAKEAAHDYRYFPEPDLVPVVVSDEWKENVIRNAPELPLARKWRMVKEYGIPSYDAGILTEEKDRADRFENACVKLKDKTPKNYKIVSNWIIGEVLHYIGVNKVSPNNFWNKFTEKNLAGLVDSISSNLISNNIAKDIFPDMVLTGNPVNVIIKSKGLAQIEDETFIEKIIDEIIAAHPGEVEKYRSGKNNLFGFFVGQALKATQGKANPKIVNEILKRKLDAA